jgi:hypothetical protein
MATVKVFKDNYEPIQYELIDDKGNHRTITQKRKMTAEVLDELDKIVYKNRDSTYADKYYKQMEMFFGETLEFWQGFDIHFLGNILESFVQDSKKKS